MFEGLFPDDVIIEWGDPNDPSKPLFPEEEAVVARAVLKRKREFAKGRERARVALERLGLRDVVLLPGKDREPLWPTAVVGSITHTTGLCAAAVARAELYEGIGIDAEPAEALESAVVDRICRDTEAALPEGITDLDAELVPRLVFCAKEAFYKFQFPITRTFLEFDAVKVELEPGAFRVRLEVDARPFKTGESFDGTWRKVGSHVVTAVWRRRRLS